MLNLIAHGPERLGQLAQTKLQPRFDCAEWRARRSGDFAMAHSGEKRQLDRFALITRKILQPLVKKAAQIGALDFAVGMACRCGGLGLLLQVCLIALLHPAIRLLAPQPINRGLDGWFLDKLFGRR